MKHWLVRLSLGVILTLFGIACSARSSSGPEPQRVSRTTQAITGGITGLSVVAGWGNTCELLSDDTVQCWGDNGYGELGLGVYGGTHTAPVRVPGLSGVQAISGNHTMTCALLLDRTVWCWGYGYGSAPVNISGVTGAVSISASSDSWSHACAVMPTGTVSCWGDNTFGQLGNGTNTPGGQGSTTAAPVSNLSGVVVAVAAHAHGTCALLQNGTVQCWGANLSGELGTGFWTAPDTCYAPYNWPCSTLPESVTGLNNVTAIAAGDGDYVCALQQNGTVSCWGDNTLGQLGDGTTTASAAPVAVTGLSGVPKAISAGTDHSCAVLSNGTVQCWGSNGSGQLGSGTTSIWWGPSPVIVVGVSGATAVSAGGSHSCALLTDGSVMCWGQNTYGQLGDGTQVSSPVAQGRSPGVNPIEIAAGYGQTCLLLPNGKVQCWGDESYGELGLGRYGPGYPIPITVPGLSGVTAVSGNHVMGCALLSDQTVKCWGNGYGPAPVAISGVSGAVSISASSSSWSYACAVLSTGKVSCWGDNTFGELGNRTNTPGGQGSTTAGPVSNLSGAVAVAAHGYGACALLSNGTVQCWGANLSGVLGNGTWTAPDTCYAPYNWPCSTVPQPVTSLNNVVAIAAGDGEHVCALLSNGKVSCWGDNTYGQLGDGTNGAQPAPVAVTGLSGVATAIAAGMDHSCAVLSDGTVQCWGNNASGELGTITPTSSSVPLSVVGVSGAMTVSAGGSHTCALLTGPVSVECWGDNTYGQLGDGTTTNSPTAGAVAGYSPDVFPAVYGIATDSAGVTKAVFTYATGATSVTIPYGQGSNALLDSNNAFIASPPQTPPQTFVSAAHAPFVATMTGSALTWQIRTHTATATTSSIQLPTVSTGDGSKDAILPDGTQVNLDLTPPQSPTVSQEPPVGNPDPGVLNGTLQVSPSGAATYTVPIAMPPGVAGMAPNLSLVYNSQAPDGIAGQGWSLQGLSMIHKCPRTQQQDGIAQPVVMVADPPNNAEGICLDGQRLFELANGGYAPEKQDFSTILYFAADNHFEVRTKAGEIRYYGMTARLFANGLDPQTNATTAATAVWALDRVRDVWGNYFDVHYNLDTPLSQTGLQVSEIDYTGHMDGSGAIDTTPYASVKFHYEQRTDVRWMRYAQTKYPMNQRLKTITTDLGTYTLNYDMDPDGVISELSSIHYCAGANCPAPPDCTGATCPPDLKFGWVNTAHSWTPSSASPGYSLPTDIPMGNGLAGTQFIDLNGDGLTDLVYAGPDKSGNNPLIETWLNNGSGWSTPNPPIQPLPSLLAPVPGDQNIQPPPGARFADMDGDGVLDFIVDNVSCGALPKGCPSVWLNRIAQNGTWKPAPEFGNLPWTPVSGACNLTTCSTFATLQPINFNAETTCDSSNTTSAGCHCDSTNDNCNGFTHMTLLPAMLVDVNGDGKMDIVRVEEGGKTANRLNEARLEILINQGAGSNPAWLMVRPRQDVLPGVQPCATTGAGPTCLDFLGQPPLQVTLGDFNRDGFSDQFRERYFTGAHVNADVPNPLFAFQQVALNQVALTPKFAPTKTRWDCSVTGTCGNELSTCGPIGVGHGTIDPGTIVCTPFGPQIADLDGDGLYDEVLFGLLNRPDPSDPSKQALSNLASGLGVALNNGAGPWLSSPGDDASGFVQELSSLNPTHAEGVVFIEDFAYALADINGDGLPDLIRNHYNCLDASLCGAPANGTNAGGGEVFFNTGTTWGSGSDQWHRSAGGFPVPGVVPSPITAACGGAFVDLNGDGIVDFIQEDDGSNCTGSKVGRGAWINTASPPVIQTFPNGRAPDDTRVSYVHITEPLAHSDPTPTCNGVNTNVYCDDAVNIDAGTKSLATPLRVVTTVSKANGTGISFGGATAVTSYTYHSLRADSNGRGPLGFSRVTAYDHVSGIMTDTSYAQAFPYTGMPTEVKRTQVTSGNAQLSDTNTQYCDSTDVGSDGGLNCFSPGTAYPQKKSAFVYPFHIVDTTFINQDTSRNQQTTESKYQYDASGNSTHVSVTTTATVATVSTSTTSTATVTTMNQYGSSDSRMQQQGKATDVVVNASGDASFGLARSHHTRFVYDVPTTYGGASATALVLVKTELEPDSVYPIREDEAFSYDKFGNVITTTTCANDFENCMAGATSQSSLPFRTTMVSFNPADFNAPTGSGLISALTYGNGRFPVRTTTMTTNGPNGGSTAHVEYSAYDAIKGVLLQKTDQNGIHTCYTYDALGRPTSEIARCGSNVPIASSTSYFSPAGSGPGALAPGTPPNTVLVTVARSISGAASWSFTDYDGKPAGTLARSFGGGFIGTLTTYNALGQVVTASKPFLIQNFTDTPPTIYQTQMYYDGFNRVRQVIEDLGGIGTNVATNQQLVTTTTYSGLSLTTTRTVNGCSQARTETKNVLGKLQSVVTPASTPASGCNGNTPSTEIDYQYDPDGNLLIASTPTSVLVNTLYDVRGRKKQSADTDLGTWNYQFDGFGELVSQTDANNHQFTMTYDELGRMQTKQNVGSGETAQWIYDTATGAGIGKLAAMVSEEDPNFNGSCALPSGASVSGGKRAVKTYTYEALGELQSVTECADGDTFQTSYEHDAIGRQTRIHYPAVNSNQLVVGYHYTSLGYLQYLTDDSVDYGVLWQAKAMDAFGHVTDEQTRSGLQTMQNRSPGNGWLVGSQSFARSDGDTNIQNWTYTLDEVGNLLARVRQDQVADGSSSETFTYDALNRLMGASTTVSVAPVNVTSSSAYDYDANGNLMHKDGNSYNFGGCQGTGGLAGSGLHQVCSINSGPTFVYDDAGNLTSTGDRSVQYNQHNKAAQIASGAGTAEFMYGADDNRVVQLATSGSTTSRTVYVGLGGTGKSMYERTTSVTSGSTTVEHTNFIYAGGAHGGNAFAVRSMDDTGTTTATRYFSFDHLGSTTAVSDEKGHIASATGTDTELLGYDPWGGRRNPDGQASSTSSTFPPSVGNRDFTGQETIAAVGLINMNGRVYDPVIGRFLSADPDIQTASDLQNYNRYSYALNNPLRYTDPTGYDAWNDFWNPIWNYLGDPKNDYELFVAAVVCVGTDGVGCFVAGATVQSLNATDAIAEGAPFAQTVAMTAFNIGLSYGMGSLTQGILGPAKPGEDPNPIWGLVLGSASAVAQTAITDAVSGSSVGWDVLQSAALSAAQGAATYGLKREVAALSHAFAGGGGSGAAQVERAERAGAFDPHDWEGAFAPHYSGMAPFGPDEDLIACGADCYVYPSPDNLPPGYWEQTFKGDLQVVLATLPLGRVLELFGDLVAAAAEGVTTLSSSAIRFSQSSVNGVAEIAESMAARGWAGPPIDVVRMGDGIITTVDNARLLAAHLTDTPVEAIIHGPGELLPGSMAGRFGNATTWGDAVLNRIGGQNAAYRSLFPNGSWAVGVGTP